MTKVYEIPTDDTPVGNIIGTQDSTKWEPGTVIRYPSGVHYIWSLGDGSYYWHVQPRGWTPPVEPKFVITQEAVIERLLRYEVERPTTVNPQMADGGACAYTSSTDPTRHCIAGQIIFDLTGISIRPNVLCGVTGLFDADAARDQLLNVEFGTGSLSILDKTQQLADGTDEEVINVLKELGWDKSPLPWGNVVKTLRHREII